MREQRDVGSLDCEAFTTKPTGERADCDTDGHYRCMECTRRNPVGYYEPVHGWVTEDDLRRWSA